ncbi:MAG: hypothetical protein WD271_09125 [Acidimicrobiia bacterium]
MSTLWTPSGEHQPEEPVDKFADEDLADQDRAASGQPYQGAPSPEEAEEMWRARADLAGLPVTDIVANHAVGLWQLAVLHLMPDPDPAGLPTEPRLDEAQLAIDALGALVDGLGARLAPHDEALREALSQLRLAYVQVAGSGDTPAS